MSSPEQKHSLLSISQKPPLTVIVGPTAVGKTTISIDLAEKVKGEIISADSRLFYRGMDIGTAKPSLEDRQRVPHHLIDILDPDESFSLAVFQRKVGRIILEIVSRGNLPILVGGTGQYIRAVYEGWRIPPQRPHPVLREILEDWGATLGPDQLHARLAVIDPEAAAKIEPNNLRRTVRALEVIFLTGRKFSDQRIRSKDTPYHGLIIGLFRPRPELYARIDSRLDQMLTAGWVDEVQKLLEQGYTEDSPGMSAIGYQQLAKVLQGKMLYADAIVEIKRLTRRFVRRQANWFKLDDPKIRWFNFEQDPLDRIIAVVKDQYGQITRP